ncbi:hypothetical protein HPB52_023753 [Rhipicephalus sanguineus]|uniref:Reverse transcriptase domain-containing protein n=1 Tax=Rhipicephalus sanguineus TaxID=34632 RepID=A0A9D4Q4G5_RHISA|nr:hypothetical protein HPB52_023753 [Rhipicephalus sanguineus]
MSQTTAVASGLKSDLGTRVQERACQIEDELSRYCLETANRIPVNARHFIMARVFELVKLCSDLRVDAASERGAVLALQGQLVETRREVAEFHRRAILAESRATTAALADAAFPPAAGHSSQPQPGLPVGPHVGLLPPTAPTPPAMTYAAALQAGAAPAAPSTGPPGLASGPGPVLHEHVAFVTPIAPTSTPARDSLRLLKANIDPAAHDIRDVTLRQTRYGLTVFAHSRATLNNMRQAIADNTITCAALSMRIPEKRNPHVRFSGVDPDVSADEFVARVADRNPHLQLYPGKSEDLHVATCTFSATYGHGRSSCPLRNDPARAVFTRCASEGHIGTTCSIRLGDSSVTCAECRRAGLDPEGHPTGFPQSPLLLDRVARLRARTNYGVAWDSGGVVCVRFLQLNLDHAKRAFTTFFDSMETRDVCIAAVSDPYRPSQDPLAIIVTRNPPFDVCPVHVSTNVVAIFCESESFNFVFVSAYAPPHSSLEPILDELSAVLRSARSPNVILAGDFNAKHQLWGPMETDERGLQLAQFVLSSELVPLNDATSIPTFETPYSGSWIYVTFATPPVTSAGYEWLVGEDTTFSEHRLVEVRVGESPKQEKRLTSYARLQLLEALRRETWFSSVSGASLPSSDALDLVLSGFCALYTRLYTRHLRRARARPTSKPWFTPALAIERAAVAAKRRRFQRARFPQIRVVFRRQYTSALAAFRQNIREARDVHVRGYTLSCVRGSFFSEPFKEAFGRLRQFRCLPSLIAPDGTLTSTHLESASLLLHTQIAVDDPTTDEAIHASTRVLAAEPSISRYQDVPFTYSEVVDVLRNTPKKSAPGPDHISPVIMKALFKFHPGFFLMVFNAALHLGYFPRCWRTARVSFIHKPGRPPERTSSYRPICVSSVFGKTLERLLNGRLQHFLLKRDLVHPRQFGFTKGRSSLLALHELTTHLLNLKAQRMTAVLMSLDFHGAFDSVWHPLVLRYFREHDLPSGLYHLLRTFLADRSVFVRYHAGQVEARPTLGSPQGSPLSPLLWNVVIDSLLSLRMPRGVIMQAYADDTIILVPAPSRDALGDLASRVLRRVVNWSRAVKVSLNCDKTFCVLFTHGVGGMERVRPTIRLSPTDPTLQFRDTLRVVGVVFDRRRLSFFHHADYLRQKVALIASRVATFFAMQRSYVRPVHKVLMYRQVILPALTYACPVWWGEDHVDCRLHARLVTVQRVALLALSRAYARRARRRCKSCCMRLQSTWRSSASRRSFAFSRYAGMWPLGRFDSGLNG